MVRFGMSCEPWKLTVLASRECSAQVPVVALSLSLSPEVLTPSGFWEKALLASS